MAKHRKLHEKPDLEDIRYRGPISFQGFQAAGWLCISLSVAVLMINTAARVRPDQAERFASLTEILYGIASLSLPFLLISNFSKILGNTEQYRNQLVRNGGAAAAVFAAGIFFFQRYLIGTVQMMVSDPGNVQEAVTEHFSRVVPEGFVAFNIFIDLFLCTLFMYFVNGTPKRFFTGKKRILFRLFALLPVAYEVASILLKWKAAEGSITLPLWSFPLLTVKPPLTFIVFMCLALHIKRRELHFLRHGRTQEEYRAFLGTNRNSLNLSVYMCLLMAAAALIDILVLSLFIADSAGGVDASMFNTEMLNRYAAIGKAMGFGKAVPLILVAPVVLLYSYTRKPRYGILSILIPIGAILLMILMVVEGIHQGIGILAQGEKRLPSVYELLYTFQV